MLLWSLVLREDLNNQDWSFGEELGGLGRGEVKYRQARSEGKLPCSGKRIIIKLQVCQVQGWALGLNLS